MIWNILLFIWQLPQNLLGLVVKLITGAELYEREIDGYHYRFYVSTRLNESWSGVSLGDYIIFAKNAFADNDAVKHESGHQKQSAFSGWFYIVLIGIPSFLGNIWDRLFHQNWYLHERIEWYYKLPWEHSADVLGGVDRGF